MPKDQTSERVIRGAPAVCLIGKSGDMRKQISREIPGRLTKEERRLVCMYRQIGSRWEQRCLFILMQSLSWGRLGEGTDRETFEQLWRNSTR